MVWFFAGALALYRGTPCRMASRGGNAEVGSQRVAAKLLRVFIASLRLRVNFLGFSLERWPCTVALRAAWLPTPRGARWY